MEILDLHDFDLWFVRYLIHRKTFQMVILKINAAQLNWSDIEFYILS